MSQPTPSIAELTFADLDAMLWRAMRTTLILGLIAACAVLLGAGWRSGAMLMIGAFISAASIWEWQRLTRLIQAKLEKQQTPANAPVVVLFFVLRLTVFAGVIYGSLKFLNGSVAALLCGLALALVTIGWEAMRLLRG